MPEHNWATSYISINMLELKYICVGLMYRMNSFRANRKIKEGCNQFKSFQEQLRFCVLMKRPYGKGRAKKVILGLEYCEYLKVTHCHLFDSESIQEKSERNVVNKKVQCERMKQ